MDRRSMLKGALTGLGAILSAPAIAETITQTCVKVLTPKQTPGPFYPKSRLQDQNSDLVKVDGQTKEAEGQKILIKGKIVDQNCQPVAGALVDMWQACASGRYNHPNDPNTAPLDPNFQYSAQILTAQDGTFSVRTIIPGAYPAEVDWMRPPHIHFRIAKLGYKELITQTYFSTFKELNEKDLILQELTHAEQETVVVEVKQPELTDHVLGKVDFAGEITISIQKARGEKA